MITRQRLGFALTIAATLAGGISVLTAAAARRGPAVGAPAKQSSSPQGQTATLLPDGRWLLLGGETPAGVSRAAVIMDPRTGLPALTTTMTIARAGHTATVLPDGTVLIIGGRDTTGQLADVAELFDPDAGVFMPITFEGSSARAGHSATLLTDGRVLVVGGIAADRPVAQVEIWDAGTQRVTGAGQLRAPRSGQTATLLGDGRVALSGGLDSAGRPVTEPEIFDPSNGQTSDAAAPIDDGGPTRVVASMPVDGAADVPVDVRLALRFSRPLRVTTIDQATVRLQSDDGVVNAHVVAAEGGRLAFVTPLASLREDTRYTLTVDGGLDAAARPLAASAISFVTAKTSAKATAPIDDEAWTPDARSREKGWRTDRPASPWESLPPLMAAPGTTAISGRVLTLDGRPLPGVSLSVEGLGDAQSDRTGRFLLELKTAATARRLLRIDGASASKGNRRYGFFEYGTTVNAGVTNVLPFTIWQPKLDTAHQVTIASPTTSEVVVTTPYIPGLELHLPRGTTIRGEDGKAVTTVSITAIPVDRPPFPLAKNVDVPVYFTIQPGGAYVSTPYGGTSRYASGAWLVYPNYRHEYVGKRIQFFHYEPQTGWYVYGMGTVMAGGAQVMPDAKTRLHEFTGAMINSGPTPPPSAPPPGDCCGDGGDPVNLATGLFELEQTDLFLPDTMPIAVTRSYRSRDPEVRPFGPGTTHPYAMYLHSEHQYTEADVVLPDGAKLHYIRTSSGAPTNFTDAVFEHVERPTPPAGEVATSATPTAFYRSVIRWNGLGWDLTLKDGTVYVFGENAPLQAIRDRFGNTISIAHASGQIGNVTRVTSPHGRWIEFSYNGSLVTQIKDNTGRTVGYQYDANGNLWKVTDPDGGVTEYTYNNDHNMLTVKTPRFQGTNTVLVTNEYAGASDPQAPEGWVKKQTHADSGVYQFSYTVANGMSTQASVTDPLNHVRQVSFNADGYTTADIRALNLPEQETTSSVRPDRSNFVGTAIDAQQHHTTIEHDAKGNVTRTTRLAETGNPVSTSVTYEPRFNRVASVTDPLDHTTTYGYDEAGNLTSITDPLQHTTTFGYNSLGQVTSVTDGLQHTTEFAYAGGDLATTTDVLGRVTRLFTNAAGQVTAVSDPSGAITRYEYNAKGQVTKIIDPVGGVMQQSYYPGGLLQTLTDARSNVTSYTYDALDRLASRTDPLQKTDLFQVDLNGNPRQRIDRRGVITTRTYDALDRLHQIAFVDGSTITYVYDQGSRLTQIQDSVAGTITRTYDDLNRLTTEETPQGTLSYTYDATGRRKTMTVAGQSAITYDYDDAGRLTSVSQAGNTVTLTYDDGNRRTSLTLPNGVVTDYGYDDANQLTSLTYRVGQVTLGNLTYGYDSVGRRTQIGGTFARTGLPQPIASASYDAANRLTSWGSRGLQYDDSGNLVSDGPSSYSWNARNQLAGLSGDSAAGFQYDGLHRRVDRSVAGAQGGFAYDGDNAVQQLSAGVPVANLLGNLATDETWARTDTSGTRWTLADALGSTVAQVDPSGAIQTQFTYEPFGKTQTAEPGATPFAYTGRESEPALQLYYYRARYYSPELQRFLSEDPVEFAGGLNLYAYAANSPVNLIDPDGTCPCTVTVRCRAVDDSRTKSAGAQHCYIVTKDRDGKTMTTTAGEINGRPEGWMGAWNRPGHPIKGNNAGDASFFDQTGDGLCGNVDCIRQTGELVDKMHLPYNFLGPNSNTFVVEVMRICNLAVLLPPQAIGADAMLGPWKRLVR